MNFHPPSSCNGVPLPRELGENLVAEMERMGSSGSSTGPNHLRHRQKNVAPSKFPLSMASARPVNRSEFAKHPAAMDAYWKEWSNLESKEVWKWSSLTEWDDVAAKAKGNNEEIHFGYLFGFMVIKGDEFEEGDPRRRWKYRIVFQGNNVKDQDW